MRDEDDQLHIYKLYGINVPRVIRADKSLRARIGPHAKINDDQIAKAQDVLDKPRIDFQPYAVDYIKKIREGMDMASVESYAYDSEYYKITVPLTQIKGQAGMFGNPLASEVSAMVLKFIEHYQRLDKDILNLLDVYCNTITLSYDQKLFNVETPGGKVLISELNEAMQRYVEKFKKMTGR